MKKGLIAMLGLMAVTCLAACNNNPSANQGQQNPEQGNSAKVAQANVDMGDEQEALGEEEHTEDNQESTGSESAQIVKRELSIDDLNEIDSVLFPVSYTYETYNWETWEMTDSGEYVYPEDIDHSLLLPIHATMAERTVDSSSIEDDMIYTTSTVTLQDGNVISILYINNPSTLQYVAASVNNGSETTLYTFAY